MKKKVLLTGANGFIGQSYCDNLGMETDIYALDCQDKFCGESNQIKAYISSDIRKPFHLDTDFDTVIHLAALNRTNINSDFTYDEYKEVNVNGTKNVIKSCNFKRFILFSTANVYEKTGNQLDETSPVKPNSFYERSKFEAELVCGEHIDPEKLVIVRPVNITGIKQANKAIIPYFFNRAINNESIEVFVPQNRKVQLLSVDDLINALNKIISIGNIHGIFNLSGKGSMEVKNIAERIISICNSSSDLRCTNSNLEDYSEVISLKAQRILNWYSKVSVEAIIDNFAEMFFSKKILR